VQELQGTYNVFVVGQDSVVQIRTIKTADRSGSDWVVAEGLEPADRIVVEGLQKVRPGVKVRPTSPKAAARDSTAPKTAARDSGIPDTTAQDAAAGH
jgi:membrane fusion protein (multidrug efflux system)